MEPQLSNQAYILFGPKIVSNSFSTPFSLPIAHLLNSADPEMAGLLDERVGLGVHAAGGFVHQDDATAVSDASSDANPWDWEISSVKECELFLQGSLLFFFGSFSCLMFFGVFWGWVLVFL